MRLCLVFSPDGDSALLIHLVWSEDIPPFKIKKRLKKKSVVPLQPLHSGKAPMKMRQLEIVQ